MDQPLVLSYVQTRLLLEAQQAGQRRAQVSPDLGLTTVEVDLTPEGVVFPDGQRLSWEAIEEISVAPNNCFIVKAGQPRKIMTFSQATNRLYSLMPTERAPTLLISGIPMHRIKDTNPYRDTVEKIKAIRPVVGQVLDTATGLGYTAIEAAKTADQVITVEVDPAVLEIARQNPWSRALFDNSRIRQRIGDADDVVRELEDASFDRIIHDPPAFSLAGHLYSADFYGELYRVLRPGGRLFHYVGNPDSPSGRSVTQGVIRRLQAAGFRRVVRRPRAFGVVAFR